MTARIERGGQEPVPERKEVPVRGDFAEFLSKKFFAGAVEAGLFKPKDADGIPHVVDQLLGSLFPGPNEQPLFSDMMVIGSVPKAIAWDHITGNIPESFWPLHRYLSGKAGEFKRSKSKVLHQFAAVFDETPIDLNVKVTTDSNTSGRLLMIRLADHFGIPEKKIESLRLSYSDEQEKITQDEFHFTQGNYLINVRVQPLPSNRYVESLIMSIRDRRTKRERYRVYISERGRIQDKRTGTTTLKQDECITQLTHENGRLVYTMGKDAIDVMRGQDSFDTDKTDTGGLLEVFFRGLRQNLLHTLHDSETNMDYVMTSEGNRLDLPQFTMLFPRFMSGSDKSTSLFGLQTKLLELQFKGELRLPYENKKYMRLLQRELALCFTIDPYTTIQALRDSGVALALPGLQELTEKEWNKILTSLHMMMDLATMTAFPRNPNLEYMVKQRAIYLGQIRLWRDSKPIHFDGLERSIQALYKAEQPKKADEWWKAYLRLWYERRFPPVRRVDEKDAIGPYVRGELNLPIGDAYFRVVRSDGKPVFIEDLIDAVDSYSMNHQKKKAVKVSKEDQIEKALDFIDYRSHVPWVSAALSSDKKGRLVITARGKELERLQSLGLIAAFLLQTPGSVTPKQLEVLYNKISNYRPPIPFSEAFFDLKLTGFVVRDVKKRVNKHGDIVDMPMYRWETPRMATSVTDSFVRDKLFPFYDQVVGKGTFNQASVRREEFEEAMDRLRECHIHSTEVIDSLSPEEDGLHIPEDHREKILQDIRILQLALAKQREESDEW